MMLLSWPMPRCCVSGRNFSNWTSPSRSGSPTSRSHGRGTLSVWSVARVEKCRPGVLNSANAPYVLKTLEAAVEACQLNIAQAMVTAPVHKGIINQAGIVFSGHTEFLQEKCGAGGVVMMLATEGLRVALATTHMPLRDVPDAITGDRLSKVIRILDKDLKHHFGITQPRILVAGLNPHAGEGGHLGREEIDVIEPALKAMSKEGMDVVGPLPADTLFTPITWKRRMLCWPCTTTRVCRCSSTRALAVP